MIFSFGKNMTSQIVILNLTPYKLTVCQMSGNLVINPCHREAAVFGAHYDRLGTHISSFKHRFWGGGKTFQWPVAFHLPGKPAIRYHTAPKYCLRLIGLYWVSFYLV